MQLLRLLPTRREEFRAANCKPSSTEGKNEGRQRKTQVLGQNGWFKPCLKPTSGLSIHKGHSIPLLFEAKLSWVVCLLTSKVLIQALASARLEAEFLSLATH